MITGIMFEAQNKCWIVTIAVTMTKTLLKLITYAIIALTILDISSWRSSAQYTVEDELDENEIESPINSELKEMLVSRRWTDAIRRCHSHPAEAAQWDIGAIYDNPRPKYTRFDINRPEIPVTRIYTQDDDDESKLEWIYGGQDMASAWGNREMIKSRGERRLGKGRWRRGFVAMHWAAMNQAPLQVFKALYAVYPEGIEMQGIDGKLPLHSVIDSRVSADLIQYMISKFPEASRVQCNQGSTPLHIASQKFVTDVNVLDILLTGDHTDASKVQNVKGQLPLHLAVSSGNSPAIEMLLQAYPEGASVMDEDGALPFHHAMSARRIDPKSVELVLMANPDAVKIPDKNNMLPLHYATKKGRNSDFEFIQRIVEMFPSGASVQDSNGMLPIHWLAQRGYTIPLMELLLDAYPESGSVKDQWDRTPMFIVNKRRKDEDRYDVLELMEQRLQL